MPFGRRKKNLDVSSKRKSKYKKKTTITNPTNPEIIHQEEVSNDSICPLTNTSSSDSSDSDSTTSTILTSIYATLKARRQAISYAFLHAHNNPPKDQWPAVAKLIRTNLCIPTYHTDSMYKIFENTLACEKKGIQYEGEYKRKSNFRPTVQIDKDSVLAQVIADAIEDGYSERQATVIGNNYQLSINSPFITRNQVKGLVKTLQPEVSAVERTKQGSSDPSSPWSMARKNWMTQLLVRFNIIKLDNPPPYHNPLYLTKLNIQQIGL